MEDGGWNSATLSIFRPALPSPSFLCLTLSVILSPPGEGGDGEGCVVMLAEPVAPRGVTLPTSVW